MFEKEAEEKITKQYGTSGEYITRQRIWQDGAEFGYNKGFKEGLKQKVNITTISDCPIKDDWHYVKDEDLPNTEPKDYTYIRRRKRYERQFTDYRVIKCFVLCQNEKGKITAEVGYFDCNKKCFFDKAEGKVIAWQEIVFPKENE